ncbi:cilia- and flagella-associated protein 43 isoform 2-T2 [Spinachia spinachia]
MDDIGSFEVRWIRGFTNKSIEFVDNKTVCYKCGDNICFLDLQTKKQNVFPSPGKGIGALTVNGNHRTFAFSEEKLTPSIFVYIYPELQLRNELKGSAQLDFTSLSLSTDGPYLACCSSLPDHTITVWNWENAEPICTKPHAGQDVISLVFNPLNWLQLCALGKSSLTVWNIEKSANIHLLKPSVIELPANDGSFAERLVATSQTVTETLPYFGLEMPPSAVSGLVGEKAESILTKLCTKARLTPSAICWTPTSELYVGCVEGFLLLVNPESLSVSVIFNPTNADAVPELKNTNFQSLSLNHKGVIAVGKERTVHCVQVKATQINITQTWQLEEPVTTVMYSPDCETLLFSSNTGQIYVSSPTRPGVIVKLLDFLSGDFVAAALSHTDKNICVSVRDSGVLQLWSANGICLGSLSLQAKVTSLACCPIAQYAAVGTALGYVLFIDLNREQQPRLVHRVSLHHTPVDHLVFDQEGHYLLTGASDSYIYVLDAKPSKTFSVIGYTVVHRPIMSLSVQCIRQSAQVKVLAQCSGQQLTVLSLPTRDLSGPDCVDRHGCLSTLVLKASTYEVPDPLNSCVLGVSEVFAYCQKRRTLQRFELPQSTDGPSCEQVVQLKPEQEVRGHPLGPASLFLSPHRSWLASVGRDGLLLIRETASMERHIELQCHSCRLGGVRSVSFSADSQTVLTAGLKDCSLVCTDIRINSMGAAKMAEATRYSQSMKHLLKNIFHTENPVLVELPEWGQASPPGTVKPEGSEGSGGGHCVDVTQQDESYNSLPSAPLSHPTWLESRREAIIKEDNEQYSETKKNLKKTIIELRQNIQEMMRENEHLPDIERLEQEEFNLDVEEQRSLEAMVEQEVTRVRNEIELENLAKRYLRDVLRRECWESLKVKGKAIKAFHSEQQVKNYPLKEQTDKEVEDLHQVHNVRKMEKAASTSNLDKSFNPTSVKEEEQGEEGPDAESAAVTGSFSAELVGSNPYIYDQFSLQTTEQKINQIILLQDVIRRIKTAFNIDFEAVYKQKVQELNRVKDRNRHITEIMLELDLREKLWEPGLTISEQPERLLAVDHSEIKAEKYLSPEQKKEEERKKLEEQKSLGAKGDTVRDRALDDMMNAVIEVKKDILKMEITRPGFVLTKADKDWSEEEKKVYKEYEKKKTALSEEKEKYKKSIETEMKKLQASSMDATERFDETLSKLFEKKVKCEMAIYQEELKVTYLVYSVLGEEEIRNRELELKLKLEKTLAFKEEMRREVKRHEEELEFFQETYESTVAEDKVLDKDFRKEFFDVRSHVVDNLYKLFKNRPRVQKMRTQTDNSSILFKEQRLWGPQAPDALSKMLKAMEELDAPENIPVGVSPQIWERFCLVRRVKVECEQKVKVKALTLAEMHAFLQRRREEDSAAQQEIKNLSDELQSLHRDKNRFLKDIMVQVLLKQGQVEVSTTGLTADYTDSVLSNRSEPERLNRTIRTLGEQKIATMVECKDFRKGIIKLQWELRMMGMQIEHLNTKARDIQMLRLSEEQQDYLNKTGRDNRVSKQVSIMEKTLAFQEKTHLKSVKWRMKKIEQLNRQAAEKAKENATIDRQLPDMQVTVAERTHIYEAIASEDNHAAKTEERYQEILVRSNLEECARVQAEELAFLWAEVERLRMKNFPSLDQLKHD